jgi:membrane protein required for colicin V production
MNAADYLILGLLAVSLWIGWWRGFVKEIVSLSSWIIAIWVGLSFSRQVSMWLPGFILPISARILISYLILVICILVFGILVSDFLQRLVKKIGLVTVNRLTGLALGAGRGIIIICIIVILTTLTPLTETNQWKNSILIPFFQTLIVGLREQTLA